MARRRSRRRSRRPRVTLAVTGVLAAAALHANAAPRSLTTAAWPLPARDWSQFRRVDEGVDLQYPGTRPVPVYAVAPGRVVILGPDPNGFGDAYPGLVLDQPAKVAGRTFTEVYYGHTFPDRTMAGRHVSRGGVIGHTGGLHSGGNAYPKSNWLEIGFFPPSYANGALMRQWLSARRAKRTAHAAPEDVQKWISEAVEVMTAHGTPASALNRADIALIIQHESGGDPRAVNTTDSNAAAGHPSQGLMQTIPGTFRAHCLPGYCSDITDPVSNIIAGVRYALARYGALGNVPGVAAIREGLPYIGY